MPTRDTVERELLVFSVWAVFGPLGMAFMLEGLTRDSFLISLVGIATIVAAFIGHIIVNEMFRPGFRRGETALGVGAFGLLAFVFIAGWASGDLSTADYWSGLALFGVLVVGLLVYISTRHGLRGAFSRFHRERENGKGSA